MPYPGRSAVLMSMYDCIEAWVGLASTNIFVIFSTIRASLSASEDGRDVVHPSTPIVIKHLLSRAIISQFHSGDFTRAPRRHDLSI
jgi:hypothetical protein